MKKIIGWRKVLVPYREGVWLLGLTTPEGEVKYVDAPPFWKREWRLLPTPYTLRLEAPVEARADGVRVEAQEGTWNVPLPDPEGAEEAVAIAIARLEPAPFGPPPDLLPLPVKGLLTLRGEEVGRFWASPLRFLPLVVRTERYATAVAIPRVEERITASIWRVGPKGVVLEAIEVLPPVPKEGAKALGDYLNRATEILQGLLGNGAYPGEEARLRKEQAIREALSGFDGLHEAMREVVGVDPEGKEGSAFHILTLTPEGESGADAAIASPNRLPPWAEVVQAV